MLDLALWACIALPAQAVEHWDDVWLRKELQVLASLAEDGEFLVAADPSIAGTVRRMAEAEPALQWVQGAPWSTTRDRLSRVVRLHGQCGLSVHEADNELILRPAGDCPFEEKRLPFVRTPAAPSQREGVTPGGFRVGTGLPISMASVRESYVLQGDRWISQSTLRGRASIEDIASLDVQIPAVVSSELDGTRVGIGQLRLGFFGHGEFGHSPITSVSAGFEIAAPLTGSDNWTTMWGSIGRETVPAGEWSLVTEVHTRVGPPTTWRLGFGVWGSPYLPPLEFLHVVHFVAEAAFASVLAAAGPFSLVLEGEAIVDWTPASVRPIIRFDLENVSVDLGAEQPLAPVSPPHIIAQIRVH